jgi:hypothetical protein
MKLLNKVKRVMEIYPQSRDSDRDLLLRIWHIEGLELSERQRQKFMQVSSAESITRARRKIQEEELEASEAIDNARYNKFKDYRGGAVSWL